MTIPLLADKSMAISRAYGVLKEDEGLRWQCDEVARFKTGMPVLNGRLGKIARFSPVFLRFRPFFCDFWT